MDAALSLAARICLDEIYVLSSEPLGRSTPVVVLGLHQSSYDALIAREVTKFLGRRPLIGAALPSARRIRVLRSGGYRLLPRSRRAESVRHLRNLIGETRDTNNALTWVFPHGERVRAATTRDIEGGGLTVARLAGATTILAVFVIETYRSLRPTAWVRLTEPLVCIPENHGQAKAFVRDRLVEEHKALVETLAEESGDFVPILRNPPARVLVGSAPLDLRELNRALGAAAPSSRIAFQDGQLVVSSIRRGESPADASTVVAAVRQWYGPHTAEIVSAHLATHPKSVPT